MSKIDVTKYGFIFNNLTVERICDHPKDGTWIYVTTGKYSIEIRATKGGKLRVGNVEKVKNN
jgi:hypothetical protein